MNCMLTELPSGEEVNRSVWTLNPLDGAISSVSMASRNAFMPSALAVAELVASSASSSSRLATLAGVGSSNVANTALIRGSTRGSSASFDAMTSSYGFDGVRGDVHAVAGKCRFGHAADRGLDRRLPAEIVPLP